MISDEASYSWQVALDAQTIKISSTENDSSKVLVDDLKEGFGSRIVDISRGHLRISSIAINPNLSRCQ